MSGQRGRLLGLIHLGVKALGYDRETYEAVLREQIGLTSCRTASVAQLRKVLAHLEAKGYRPRRPRGATRRPAVPRLSEEQLAMIRGLWLELRDLGELRNPYPEGLNRYVERQERVSQVHWLEPGQAARVIEALKSWVRRVERSRLPVPGSPLGNDAEREGR